MYNKGETYHNSLLQSERSFGLQGWIPLSRWHYLSNLAEQPYWPRERGEYGHTSQEMHKCQNRNSCDRLSGDFEPDVGNSTDVATQEDWSIPMLVSCCSVRDFKNGNGRILEKRFLFAWYKREKAYHRWCLVEAALTWCKAIGDFGSDFASPTAFWGWTSLWECLIYLYVTSDSGVSRNEFTAI